MSTKNFNSDSCWEKAYKATPKFYLDSNGVPFGAFALTEDTLTIIPINPKNDYTIDGNIVDNWKIIIVSTTTNSVLYELDYFKTIELLSEKYRIDTDGEFILIKGISFDELKQFGN